MSSITAEQARWYLDPERWRLVEEQEILELRSTPMEIKARQLAALMAARHLFSEDRNRENEVAEVRARWARIRRAYGV